MSEPGPSDRHVAHWRDHRDVTAIQRLFDATAPRLTLIAARLVGDGDAARDVVQRVRAAIDRLPAASRSVLSLHLIHRLAPLEIAGVLEQNHATVCSRLRCGMERLRDALRRDGVVWSGALLQTRRALTLPPPELCVELIEGRR